MEGNTELIDKLVSNDALKQLENLDRQLAVSFTAMEKLLGKVHELSVELSKAGKSWSELTSAIEKQTKVEQESADLNERQTKILQQRDSLAQKIIQSVKLQSKAQLDLNAMQKQEEEAVKRISSLLAKANGYREDNLKKLVVEQNELGKVKNEISQLEKKYKSFGISQDEYIEKKSTLLAKEQEHKQAISELQITLKNQTKIEQSRNGTMEQESLILGNLRMAWRGLTEEQKNTAAGKQLLSTIQELDDKLKQNDGTIGNHQRKVGNYEIAAKTLRQELINIKQELSQMALEGDNSSEAYQKLQEKAVSLQKAVNETNKEIQSLSTPGTKLQAIGEGIGLIISSYTALKSAMAAFGVENESLEKSIMRVMAAASALNAIQQINNALFKKTALNITLVAGLKGWWTKVTAKATIAQTAETVAANAGNIANKGLAGSFKLLGTAIKSVPVFGWIIAGITAIIGLVSYFSSKTGEAKKATEEFNKAVAEIAYKPIAAINELSTAWSKLGNNIKEKEKFIKNNYY